jgi:hypothetical protein
LDESARQHLRNIENTGSEQAFVLFRDHVISKNAAIRPYVLRPGELHFDMIQPILGNRKPLQEVKLHFSAYVPGNNAAITFGNNVYIRDQHRHDDPYQALVVAHEMTHCIQFDHLGGEHGFARRYVGQIAEALRNGRLNANGRDFGIHNVLELEQEAFGTERSVGRNTKGVVTIENPTDLEIHYALKTKTKDNWKRFTLGPNRIEWHWSDFSGAATEQNGSNPESYTEIYIHFDCNFAPGYQEKAYHLADLYFMGENPRPENGRFYRFGKTQNGIDLFNR